MPVFKKNFISCFLNPTGYVFICVFVLLCSAAAFLPDEFVNSNLANSAQLNLWFPLIMLFFVPAMTMGLWADERRQGTEELLLTLPVSPTRLILGKYFAAVAVFTVSLLFAMIANYLILDFLGSPDPGLFLATCLGYELIGVAMIAVGMVASFLTANLTVAYILGALLNVPLIALQWSDAMPVTYRTAVFLKSFGIENVFDPFGRGIVSLSGILYFLAVTVVMLYVSLLLINRRYWQVNNPVRNTFRYCFRTISLALIMISLVGLCRLNDRQLDMTAERLGSLSPESLSLLEKTSAKYPITIEAWLSPEVPPEYVQTRLDIISVLGELKNRSREEIFLDIRTILPNTREAWQLERQYDIRPKKVVFETRGRVREEAIFLTIIFRCGPRTIVIPFLNRGLSVEYELVGSLLNIGERPKKSIGVLRTDATLLGRRDEQGRETRPMWSIIDELAKQYQIIDVDPAKPIPTNRYDVLLAVQPSSLGPEETVHFLDALRRGQPTVMFEDPYPLFAEFTPGTLLPRKGRTPTESLRPKGEFGLVPAMLGIRFGTEILWKNYNPYPKLAGLSEEFIFIDAVMTRYDTATTEENPVGDGEKPNEQEQMAAFSPTEKSVASLEHLLFPFCGSVEPDPRAETVFTPLVRTEAGGTSSVKEMAALGIRSRSKKRNDRANVYTVAARVSGKVPVAFQTNDSQGKNAEFNVIIVTDLDLLTPGFFRLREMGTDVRSGVIFDFDNVTFVLNLVDTAAKQEELIPIRSRRSHHRTLTRIEQTTRKIRNASMVEQIAYMKEFDAFQQKEAEKLNAKIQELVNRKDGKKRQLTEKESLELDSAIVGTRQRVTRLLEEKQRQYDRKVEESQREVDEYVRKVQGRFKLYAVLLPPLFPIAVAVFVLFRRKRESTQRISRKNG